MAGDWLQIDLDLPEKPEVQAIARASAKCPGLSEVSENVRSECALSATIGRLMLFWRWVERHASCEIVRRADLHTLVALCGGDEDFWRAVEAVGWVSFTDEGVVIPGWKKRFSKSAKNRAKDAKRKRESRRDGSPRVRKASEERPQSVRKASEDDGQNSDLKKNREEKNIKGVNPLKPPGVDVGELTIPETLDTPEVREALADWIRYKRQRGQPYKTPKFLSDFLVGFIADGPSGLVAAIRNSLGQNYAGIFRSSEKPHGKPNHNLSPGRIYDPGASGGGDI